jgi:hypothetical protein
MACKVIGGHRRAGKMSRHWNEGCSDADRSGDFGIEQVDASLKQARKTGKP